MTKGNTFEKSRPGTDRYRGCEPFILPNGKHAGESIQRIPLSYLKWMVHVGHTHAEEARKELARRGTAEPDLEVSGHALDRASLRIRKHWHHYSEKGEGLWTWLHRMAREAFDMGVDENGRVRHLGVVWVFDTTGAWPLLKTVLGRKDPPPKEDAACGR